jgi:hypothetical protein
MAADIANGKIDSASDIPPLQLKYPLQYRFVVVAWQPSNGQRRSDPAAIYGTSRGQRI